ncbi:MAG: FHA domain-containing protein [Lachnospiraceae bacterium]|nr:FHA domain-containing protein [Lachnospiraceae bacterium]
MRNSRTNSSGRMSNLQIRYQKNLEHYYLVVAAEADHEEDYQLRMVLENRIRGLIPMEIKCREGRTNLYYDVSSMQPLTRIYDRRELSGTDIRKILYGIMDVLGEMQDYMLEEDSAILDPAYIFADMENGTIHLLFLPKGEGEAAEEDPLLAVAEFLMEHADHRDPQAALCAYRVYQTIRKGNYVTEDLRRAFEEKETASAEQTVRLPELQADCGEPLWEDRGPEGREAKNRPEADTELLELPETAEAERMESAEKNRIPFILAVVLILAGSLLLSGSIPGWYADRAGKLVAGVIVAAGAGIPFLQLRKRPDGGKKSNDRDALTPGDIEDVFADMDLRESYRTDPVGRNRSPEEPDVSQNFEAEAGERDPEENFGKTVFVGAVDLPAENILVEKGKKKEYPIDHFPYTIGKRKDCVDLALTDRSVSRIHARIVQKNGRAYLQDCRSTNGTYLNGVQLEPEESVMLEREDEIEIGKVKFSYL